MAPVFPSIVDWGCRFVLNVFGAKGLFLRVSSSSVPYDSSSAMFPSTFSSFCTFSLSSVTQIFFCLRPQYTSCERILFCIIVFYVVICLLTKRAKKPQTLSSLYRYVGYRSFFFFFILFLCTFQMSCECLCGRQSQTGELCTVLYAGHASVRVEFSLEGGGGHSTLLENRNTSSGLFLFLMNAIKNVQNFVILSLGFFIRIYYVDFSFFSLAALYIFGWFAIVAGVTICIRPVTSLFRL